MANTLSSYATLRDRGYLCPLPFNSRGEIAYTSDRLLSWSKDIVVDGRSYLRLQPAFPYIQEGLDLVNGEFCKQNVQTLSDVKLELTVRNLKELVAAQTNIRIIPSFKTEIPELEKQNAILNKAFMAWQANTFADRKIRKAWQYACAAGTGYIGVRYDPNYYYKRRGDITLDAYGPLDVLPVGMGRQHDIQKAYAVALRVETPIHEAWRLFPLYADKIHPSRESSKGRGTVISQAVKFASAVLRKFGPGSTIENEPAPWEMVDIYYVYIDDDSVNETGRPVAMGDPGTSWSYTVPFIGQDIPVGSTRSGQPITRKATRDDCLLYPLRRLVVCTEEAVLNPDPSSQVNPYWHAKVPLIQMRADDWPWLFLGMPLTRMGQSLEKANIELMRGIVDAMNVRLSPPRGFDRNTMASALMETMNTRIPNQVVGLDYTYGGDQVKPFLPVQFYDVPPIIPAQIDSNEGRIRAQMGVADATALARARQLPSGDSVEKIMEQLGPLIKDQSRNQEESIRMLGEFFKSNFFQFKSAAARFQQMGEDGLAEEDHDNEPGTLVPADPFEFKGIDSNSRNLLDARADYESTFKMLEIPHFERARWHKDNFAFSVQPYSLHELNSITRKLFHLQLMMRGFPIDWWTLADVFDIRNFSDGPPKFKDPETGEMRTAQTILEKWTVQKQIEIQMAQALQGAAPAGQQHGGRKPTGQQPPSLEQKGSMGGTRSTIRESSK